MTLPLLLRVHPAPGMDPERLHKDAAFRVRALLRAWALPLTPELELAPAAPALRVQTARGHATWGPALRARSQALGEAGGTAVVELLRLDPALLLDDALCRRLAATHPPEVARSVLAPVLAQGVSAEEIDWTGEVDPAERVEEALSRGAGSEVRLWLDRALAREQLGVLFDEQGAIVEWPAGSPLDAMLDRVREDLLLRRGIRVPRMRLYIDHSLPVESFSVQVHEVRGAPWSARAEVSTDAPPVEPLARMEQALTAALDARAWQLVDRATVLFELRLLQGTAPLLVETVLDRHGDRLLTRVLRTLAAQGVTLRPLPELLEALCLHQPVSTADWSALHVDERTIVPAGPATPESAVADLVATARRAVGQHIAFQRAGWQDLPVHLLDADTIENPLLAGADPTWAVAQILEEVGLEPRPNLLTVEPVARILREPLRRVHHDLALLAWSDLPPSARLVVAGRITG